MGNSMKLLRKVNVGCETLLQKLFVITTRFLRLGKLDFEDQLSRIVLIIMTLALSFFCLCVVIIVILGGLEFPRNLNICILCGCVGVNLINLSLFCIIKNFQLMAFVFNSLVTSLIFFEQFYINLSFGILTGGPIIYLVIPFLVGISFGDWWQQIFWSMIVIFTTIGAVLKDSFYIDLREFGVIALNKDDLYSSRIMLLLYLGIYASLFLFMCVLLKNEFLLRRQRNMLGVVGTAILNLDFDDNFRIQAFREKSVEFCNKFELFLKEIVENSIVYKTYLPQFLTNPMNKQESEKSEGSERDEDENNGSEGSDTYSTKSLSSSSHASNDQLKVRQFTSEIGKKQQILMIKVCIQSFESFLASPCHCTSEKKEDQILKFQQNFARMIEEERESFSDIIINEYFPGAVVGFRLSKIANGMRCVEFGKKIIHRFQSCRDVLFHFLPENVELFVGVMKFEGYNLSLQNTEHSKFYVIGKEMKLMDEVFLDVAAKTMKNGGVVVNAAIFNDLKYHYESWQIDSVIIKDVEWDYENNEVEKMMIERVYEIGNRVSKEKDNSLEWIYHEALNFNDNPAEEELVTIWKAVESDDYELAKQKVEKYEDELRKSNKSCNLQRSDYLNIKNKIGGNNTSENVKKC